MRDAGAVGSEQTDLIPVDRGVTDEGATRHRQLGGGECCDIDVEPCRLRNSDLAEALARVDQRNSVFDSVVE